MNNIILTDQAWFFNPQSTDLIFQSTSVISGTNRQRSDGYRQQSDGYPQQVYLSNYNTADVVVQIMQFPPVNLLIICLPHVKPRDFGSWPAMWLNCPEYNVKLIRCCSGHDS